MKNFTNFKKNLKIAYIYLVYLSKKWRKLNEFFNKYLYAFKLLYPLYNYN